MKWAHLPLAGGLYDQHPKLLDDFGIIMQADAEAEKRRHEEQERTMAQQRAAANKPR